ncbi:unnamed protein product [Cylicostephanus goldi]|uniref:Uncharacterized protein n=1 Tax=Cylicostephanus goldi TaxID=71465 RepID=A0A3P6SQK3_CYLGO|nr:unnamed protein product [Cylicostephanus goldi]
MDEEPSEPLQSTSSARVLQPFEDLSPIAEHCPNVPRFTLSDSDENPSEIVIAQRRAKFARSRSSATGASPISATSVFSKSEDFTEIQPPLRRQTFSGRMDLARRWFCLVRNALFDLIFCGKQHVFCHPSFAWIL